jgi:hypothetical protein
MVSQNIYCLFAYFVQKLTDKAGNEWLWFDSQQKVLTDFLPLQPNYRRALGPTFLFSASRRLFLGMMAARM